MDPHGYHAMLQPWPTNHAGPHCHGYVGLPLVYPTRVVVASDVHAVSDRDHVLRAIDRELRALGSVTACHGPGELSCWTTRDPQARNLMIVVTSTRAPEPALERAVGEWLDAGLEAVALLRRGAEEQVVLPQRLAQRQSIAWRNDPREALPEIMDSILLDAEDRRIFISYKRDDGQPLADRLFDRLTHARFDVFLDRFSLAPGIDFIERIGDEILDKSMVVVLETPLATSSRWIKDEIAFAAARGIGLAAVHTPGAPRFPGLPARISTSFGEDAIVDFLLEEHRKQLLARRESVRKSVWGALVGAGAPARDIDERGQGFAVTIAGRRRFVGVCVRPADLQRFRLTDEAAAGDQAFIVHPAPSAQRRKQDLSWLSDRSKVVEVDEGRIQHAAAAFVAP